MTLQDLNGLSLGLECIIPNRLGIPEEKRYYNDCPDVLVANEEKHSRDIYSDVTAVHDTMDNMLNDIHIITEPFHNTAIRVT